jgi:hypothetical protein
MDPGCWDWQPPSGGKASAGANLPNSHRGALAGGGGSLPEILAHSVVTAVASMKGGLASIHRPSPVSPPPSAAGPPPGSEEPPVPPELPVTPPSWPGLDRLGSPRRSAASPLA